MSPENIDFVKALASITSMVERSEKALQKFSQGTAQHTLLKNRIGALKIAYLLIDAEKTGKSDLILPNEVDLKKAVAPIKSLISKSEKAQRKLAQGTWQHTMLGDNLKALNIALPLLNKTLGELQ